MATDPKAAPLADDLKELALSLPTSVFPKAFFCALCSELAIDSYKLLCCNKVICTPCQTKLSFPTTCPSCDHSPLEADSCTPNKALRNTMRVWLQKQKKKEEAKAAAQAATPVAEATPAAIEAPSEVEGADKPIDSVEEVTASGDVPAESAVTAAEGGDARPRTVSASAQPNEVGLHLPLIATRVSVCKRFKYTETKLKRFGWLKSMNTIDLARVGGCNMHISPCALADSKQDSVAHDNDDLERRGSLVSQTATQSVEPSAANASPDDQTKPNGPANMMGNNFMMNGQMGFGFQGQGNFGGMGFNGMSNMMSNANWNNMNPMGTS
ncbi:uncharacterized protein M421DRAFT_421872 [Didymella exigua CBS 183.55]|uniref:RING-type domain-containing protein n=1 Tax=Didymella exigua CBS 183.55 TaxID=1150837 RepID=A0A6A5RIN4_9PLEO|nr:uncharacterized protein M421DRAFT_421872 [Didymella exigua CBS 183.55]KAF1927459.1 hypothetical protein M421DRAFT_421872 [Didymella exigua CBS 183.55]